MKNDTRSQKSILNTRKRVQITFNNPSLTEQTHRDSCDINKIVAKFSQTGQMPGLNMSDPQYGFAPEIDFKEALDLTKKLHTEFKQLSADDRAKFDHNPALYGEFLSQYAESPESFYNIETPESDTLASPANEKAKNEPAEQSDEV